jgi:LPS export ABC transporter protein LptC
MTLHILNIKNLAALLLGCFFLYSCENDRNVVNNLNNSKELEREEATFVKINYTVAGKTKAILTAPLMIRIADTNAFYEFPKTLYAEFYNTAGIKETQLTSLYGKYNDVKNIIYLRDSVKIVNNLKGDTIYCEDLYWDKSRVGLEFYTNRKVRIRQPGGQYLNLAGGMEADQAMKNIHMLKGVGVINSKGEFTP